MKILVLADGRSIHTDRYIVELKSLNHQVILASLEKGDNVDINLKRRTGIASVDYYLSSKEIRSLAREYSPDIINPHFASGYGFAVAVSGVGRKYPVLLHCLGSDILLSPQKSPLHKARVRYALSRADHILADSEFLKKKILDLGGELAVDVIPWGAENSLMPIFERKIIQIDFTHRPLEILVPRPHQKIYNNEFILAALRDFLQRREISITFPAWGDDYEKFRKMSESETASGTVRFYKFLSRDEYIQFMSGFDIYLSAAYIDSSPASLLESMAAGLFPVVCNFPGVEEWVSKESALLFENENSESLREAIDRFLHINADRREVLINNNRLIRERALFSGNMKAIANIMERLIQNAGT